MADTRTIRSFASLAGGESLARLLAFVAALLVARRLGPSMYGVIGVATGIMLYLNQLVDAGVELSGVPVVARREVPLASLVSAALSVRVVVAIILTLLVGGAGVFLLPQPDGAILALYALGLVFVATGVRWVFLGLQQARWVAIARVGGELTALAIIAVALHDAGDLAVVPVAAVTGGAVTALVMLWALRAAGIRAVATTRWQPGRDMLARAPRLVGFTLLGLVLFNADLIYLRIVSGQSAAGFYAAAYTFIAFAANLAVAWAQSVMPAIARTTPGGEERSSVLGNALLLSFVAAVPVAAGGMMVAGPLVQLVFGPGFEPAVPALVWLLPAIIFSALREGVVAALITSAGGERELIRVNAIAAVVNLALLVPVVPRYGAVGAAAVTVVTEALRFALAVSAARRHGFQMPVVTRFLKPLLAGAVMAAGLLVFSSRPLPVMVLAGILLYGVGLVFTGSIRWVGSSPRLVV